MTVQQVAKELGLTYQQIYTLAKNKWQMPKVAGHYWFEPADVERARIHFATWRRWQHVAQLV